MKHTKQAILLIAFLLLLALPSLSLMLNVTQAVSYTIYPSADAYVTTNNPTANYGTLTYGGSTVIYGETARFWFKFSLSSLPSDANITEARLYLRCFALNIAGSHDAKFSSTDSWIESGAGSITWNNQPSFDAAALNSVSIPTINAWYYWTVTNKVKDEFTGDKTITLLIVATSGDEWSYAKEQGGGVRPYLQITTTNSPSNDECTFVDPDIDSTTALAQHKVYSFQVKVSDVDGGTNINYVDFTMDYSGEALKCRWTESTDTFSEESDPMGYISLSSTSADSSLSGTQWTLIFKITFDWDYPDESLHNIQVYSLDDNAFSDTDLFNDKYKVENDLASSGLTVSDYRVNPSESLTFSGYWYYQGSASIPPPDGNYHVKVKLGATEKGEDATLVSGAFSLSGISAESSVTSYIYSATADYMAEAGSFSAVIVDKIAVTISCSDNTPAINETVTFSVSGKYAYDSSSVSTFTFQVTRNGSPFASTTPFTDVNSTYVLYVYTTSSASETAYGLNQFTTNTQQVGWGFSFSISGAYDEDGIRNGAINVTIYKHNEAPQAVLLDGSYAFQIADYNGSVLSFDLGYNESRTYYLRMPTEEIYVFKPTSPYYTYFFSVMDMAGITNGYLESLINVNGTDRVVERWSLNILSDIPFTMEWSRAYTMKLVCDQGTYVFGTFVAGAKNSFQLVVYKALFPPDLESVQGVYINALRLNNTRIQMNYTDVLSTTNWVQVRIYTLSSVQLVYSTNNTGNTQVITWDDAISETSYLLVVTADSSQWNEQEWKFAFGSLITNQNPFAVLDFLGTSIFPLSQIVGLAIVSLVFAAFSQEHIAVACIVGVIVAAVLAVIGMLNISGASLAIAFGMAVLVALSVNRKKVEAR